ncbi:hypothetical protein SAY86_022165 [Trapa natans]|uniref:SANTA domain-containing protein n=1 Tax=Trapa natans TaxID=22666 RepID=A0AAN7RMC2_TRANT|nr:hypothetical protein SAY86_022165 [Trapa natans]
MSSEEMGKMTRGSCSKFAGSMSKSRSNSLKWAPRRLVIGSPASWKKSVYLHKWWLERVNDQDLAVGGFTQRDQRICLFRSAAVIQRCEITTLETADGMEIILSGLIDQHHSNENGFPNEVCHRFMLGFPLDWEKYRNYHSREKLSEDFVSYEHRLNSGDNLNDLSSISLDDIPVARIRDLMFGLGDRDNDMVVKNIWGDMLKKLDKIPQGEPANTSKGTEMKINVKKGKSNENQTKRKVSSTVEQLGTKEELSRIDNEMEVPTWRSNKQLKSADSSHKSLRSGVSTRSMTKLWRLKEQKGSEQLGQSLP